MQEEPRWRRYLRFWKADPASDVQDELEFHIAERTALNEARGMSPAAARSEAERRFGDRRSIERALTNSAVDDLRVDARRERLSGVLQDVRFAFRTLLRNRAYALAAVVTLALGIGANTATFTVVNAVLLRPLPYPDAATVVGVHNAWDNQPSARISPAEFLDYRHVRSFESFGVYATGAANVIDANNPERVTAAAVSPDALEALRAKPLAGRLFGNGEGLPGRDGFVVLSEDFWRRRFAGSRDVLGRSINVDGQTVQIIGILPATFALPGAIKNGERVQLYSPYDADPATTTERGSHFLNGVARLRPGASVETANADIARMADGFARTFPADYPAKMKFSAWLLPVRDDVVGDVQPLILVLLAGVGFVLLVACANVSALVLTRTEDRRREIALRMALGAGQWRVTRQLVIENALLSAIGGAAGLALAFGGTRVLIALQPGDIPRLSDVSVDGQVLLFTIGVSVLAAVLFGAGPAVVRLRGAAFNAFGEGGLLRDGARTTGSAHTQKLRAALISLQVAMSIVLLGGAGLMLRSFVRLVSVDPGYQTENILTMPVSLPAASYSSMQQRRQFYDQLVTNAAAQAGVAAAGAVATLPLEHGTGDINIQIEGREKLDTEVSDKLDWNVVTPGYFDAIGIPVLHGRGIVAQDDDRATGAVVLNESAARLYWPNGDAIGHRFTLGGHAGPGVVTVVGIVGDIHQSALSEPPHPTMYLPHKQFYFWNGGNAASQMTVVIRARGNPASLTSTMRNVVRSLDSSVPIGDFSTMKQMVERSVATPRFTMTVLGIFAAVALALALIGIYGLISYTVARRTRELATRMALGARAGRVMYMVILQAIIPVAVGLVIGTAGALVLTRSLGSMLFDIEPNDPATLGAVVAILSLTAVAAAGIPARRASRIQPMRALREE
jgi:putative ABC transport system permease protein